MGLVWDTLHEPDRVLNARIRDGIDSAVFGPCAEVENLSIRRNRNEAGWQDDGMDFVFVGNTPDGKHQRVWYVDGVRVPR